MKTEKLKKLNKLQLSKVYSGLESAVLNYHAAVGDDEKRAAVERLQRHIADVRQALTQGYTKPAEGFALSCKRLLYSANDLLN